ncbi:unnamed protein product, partial [Prorocentrum cordatum]
EMWISDAILSGTSARVGRIRSQGPLKRRPGGGLGRRPPGRAAHPRAGGPGRRGGRCAGIGGLPPHGAGGGRGGREAVRLPRARWRDAARGPPRGMQVSDGVPLRPPARGRKARQRRGHGQAGSRAGGAGRARPGGGGRGPRGAPAAAVGPGLAGLRRRCGPQAAAGGRRRRFAEARGGG